jgi:hypothetical protein
MMIMIATSRRTGKDMQQQILNSLIYTSRNERSSAIKFAPTSRFWRLWKEEREEIKRLHFHPRKDGREWVVHWYRDVDGQACVRRPVVAAAAERAGPTEQQQAEKITAEPYGYQEEAIGRLCEILKERKASRGCFKALAGQASKKLF